MTSRASVVERIRRASGRRTRLAVAAAMTILLVVGGAAWLGTRSEVASSSPSLPTAASAAAVASGGSVRDLPTAVPESNLGAADTDAWLLRAALDAHSVVPAGHRLVPSMVHYDPRLSVIILRDCAARVQVLVSYVGTDPQTARLSWTDYPSAKSTDLTESERLACGW